MISLKKLKDLIDLSPESPQTEDFIKIHKAVEGYIRRLLLIGLRLNNVKYSTAQEVISLSYLNNQDLIKKCIVLISRSTQKITDFETQNPDLKVLLDLFFTFTSIYRNRLVHGIYENIENQVILNHCYYINKFLIKEFEATLIQLGYKSAFDTPTEWGATKIQSIDTFNQVITRLKLGSITKAPKRIRSVQNAIQQTKYSGLI